MGKRGIAVAWVMVFAVCGAAGADELRPRVSMRHPVEQMAVWRAVQAAAELLAKNRCQQIFSDFADVSGRPLRAKLAELELSGASYLSFVGFYDGTGQSRCSRSGVLAATQPGSRVVFVCGAQFRQAYEKNPAHAEALIIHEMLHSLGLGENPPTSAEITARVMDRCY